MAMVATAISQTTSPAGRANVFAQGRPRQNHVNDERAGQRKRDVGTLALVQNSHDQDQCEAQGKSLDL